MNQYTAKDRKEMNDIITKIMAKDRGAYVGYDYVNVNGVAEVKFPLKIETNVKINHK